MRKKEKYNKQKDLHINEKLLGRLESYSEALQFIHINNALYYLLNLALTIEEERYSVALNENKRKHRNKKEEATITYNN